MAAGSIPDTDSQQIAEIAAALHLAEITAPTDTGAIDTLADKLSRLIDAYEVIHKLMTHEFDAARSILEQTNR